MRHPMILMSLVFLGTILFGLYHLKYEVRRLDSEVVTLENKLHADKELIQVLGAEWSYLNGPERLQHLSDRFLQVERVKASQIITIRDLPVRMIDSPSAELSSSDLPAPGDQR